LGERDVRNVEVRGSIPLGSTISAFNPPESRRVFLPWRDSFRHSDAVDSTHFLPRGITDMSVKIMLSAAALLAALAIGAPAFADDTMDKPMDKPMHRTMHHHHRAVHHAAMRHEHMDHRDMRHHHHDAMGIDARERVETMKLNQQQLEHSGM
jgi:pentapeptide MXKDX repeat protein